MGKTDLAKAYIWPTLVAGILLLVVGVGLVISYNWKLNAFSKAFDTDALGALQTELAYSEKVINDYLTVFKVIPIIIALAALLILFVDKSIWRAIGISTIAIMVIILLIDGTASARIKNYNKQLELAE